MKLFTEIPLDEIKKIEQWEGADINAAKVILADECTKLLHGEECLAQIHATTQALYGGNSDGDEDLASLPKIAIDDEGALLDGSGVSVVDILVKSGLVTSRSEAKRLIKAGGARVNGEKVIEDSAVVIKSDFDNDGRLKLSSGKKKHVVIQISSKI